MNCVIQAHGNIYIFLSVGTSLKVSTTPHEIKKFTINQAWMFAISISCGCSILKLCKFVQWIEVSDVILLSNVF